MRYARVVGLVVIGLASASWAEEGRTNIGLLTCTMGKNLECGFKRAEGGAEEKYVGSISWVDQALSSDKLVLIWTVIGPAREKTSRGLLAQRFVKEKGLMGRVPALVGQKNPQIVLQSETNNGAESGSKVAEIELKLAATPA